jgi:hypothetical protein
VTRIPGYLVPVRIPGVPARPYVDAGVLIQAATTPLAIRFLIDTGADDTLLHPSDVEQFAGPVLDAPFDEHPERQLIGGVGGGTYIVPVSARLFFRDEVGAYHLRQDCRVWVAQPTATNRRLPSLLGRDLLQFFRLTLDYDATPPVLLERP